MKGQRMSPNQVGSRGQHSLVSIIGSFFYLDLTISLFFVEWTRNWTPSEYKNSFSYPFETHTSQQRLINVFQRTIPFHEVE